MPKGRSKTMRPKQSASGGDALRPLAQGVGRHEEAPNPVHEGSENREPATAQGDGGSTRCLADRPKKSVSAFGPLLRGFERPRGSR